MSCALRPGDVSVCWTHVVLMSCFSFSTRLNCDSGCVAMVEGGGWHRSEHCSDRHGVGVPPSWRAYLVASCPDVDVSHVSSRPVSPRLTVKLDLFFFHAAVEAEISAAGGDSAGLGHECQVIQNVESLPALAVYVDSVAVVGGDRLRVMDTIETIKKTALGAMTFVSRGQENQAISSVSLVDWQGGRIRGCGISAGACLAPQSTRVVLWCGVGPALCIVVHCSSRLVTDLVVVREAEFWRRWSSV